ncbi:MAG: hypothetical protein AB4050_17245 [Synechococcus sp.]
MEYFVRIIRKFWLVAKNITVAHEEGPMTKKRRFLSSDFLKGLGILAVVTAISSFPITAHANERRAVNGCIGQVETVGGPDAQDGIEVLSSEFSEAGTLVKLRDSGGTVWRCIGYSDGSVGDLAVQIEPDDPVAYLQDLIGVRGRDGERQLQHRGYVNTGGDVRDNSVLTYWENEASGECIEVVTRNGDYRRISASDTSNCANAEHGSDVAVTHAPTRQEQFNTVCGVLVGSDRYQYTCDLTNYYHGTSLVKSELIYPDNELTLLWRQGGNVTIQFPGLVDQTGTYSIYEGETDIFFEDKTYYYYSDPEFAASELRHLGSSSSTATSHRTTEEVDPTEEAVGNIIQGIGELLSN